MLSRQAVTWLATAAEPNTGGDRSGRGGYAGEPDAGLRGQVSELGDVTGNAGLRGGQAAEDGNNSADCHNYRRNPRYFFCDPGDARWFRIGGKTLADFLFA